VIRCLTLAGPPPKSFDEVPEPGEFADVVARITGDEAVLRRLVEVVERPDVDGFEGLVNELKIQRFRHLLCHWVCRVRCDLVCRWVCERETPRTDLADELRSAGESIRILATSPRAMAEAVRAVRAGDCQGLQRVLASVGLSDRCFLICFWFCSWRCLLVCLTVCRPFLAEPPDTSDAEIHAFAQAVGRLAEHPEAIADLVTAMDRLDEQAFGNLVRKLELQRFCLQLCHWLCFLRCNRFCICVCPPLQADIDTPTEGSCASSSAVPSSAVRSTSARSAASRPSSSITEATATELATSPWAWPPMPSATTSRRVLVAAESWFMARLRPMSEPAADNSVGDMGPPLSSCGDSPGDALSATREPTASSRW
jgi:hypothetical protein